MAEKASDAQKSAIDALQKFYGLIVAIAFTGGVFKFIEGFSIEIWTWTTEQTSQTILFVAFVVTIIPFYHGMERHLFETHIARNDIDWGHKGKPTNILIDIFTFMIEGALLFSLGRKINEPLVFLQIWSMLLVVDVVWSVVVWYFQKGTEPKWAWNNIRWLYIAWIAWFGILYLSLLFCWSAAWLIIAQTGTVALCEILRSVFDYKNYWGYYFPDETEERGNVVYLAGPYSNDAPNNPGENASAEKRLARFLAITDVARQLIEKKSVVYSPLTMTHPIDERMAHDPGSEFWVSFDEAFMQYCSEIYVLKLPGWDESSGVEREIEYFRTRGIHPTYLEPDKFSLTPENDEFRAAFE